MFLHHFMANLDASEPDFPLVETARTHMLSRFGHLTWLSEFQQICSTGDISFCLNFAVQHSLCFVCSGVFILNNFSFHGYGMLDFIRKLYLMFVD